MAGVEGTILSQLQGGDIPNTLDFAQKHGVDHNAVIGALKSLAADNYIEMVAEDHEAYKMLSEGEKAMKDGSPEAQIFQMIKDDGSDKGEIEQLAGALAKVGLSQCMQAKWVQIDKERGGKIFKMVPSVTDAVQEQLKLIAAGKLPAKADIDKLKKRKMIADAKYKTYKVCKGADYAPVRTKAAADITMEMMMDGSWKTQKFKPYNFDALGQDPAAGRLHPLLKVRQQFREIFLEMGFEEMPTQRFVETSFWNFDSLFQPQAHPARDMQDTFFIKDPASTLRIPSEYMQKVRPDAILDESLSCTPPSGLYFCPRLYLPTLTELVLDLNRSNRRMRSETARLEDRRTRQQYPSAHWATAMNGRQRRPKRTYSAHTPRPSRRRCCTSWRR